MRTSLLGATLAVALATTAGGMGLTSPALAKNNNNTGAVIGGLVAGAVIGAAVAGSATHPQPIYVNPKPPPPPKPNPWQNAFSPKPGITCYPVQYACYNANGAYAANWTWKVYQR